MEKVEAAIDHKKLNYERLVKMMDHEVIEGRFKAIEILMAATEVAKKYEDKSDPHRPYCRACGKPSVTHICPHCGYPSLNIKISEGTDNGESKEIDLPNMEDMEIDKTPTCEMCVYGYTYDDDMRVGCHAGKNTNIFEPKNCDEFEEE